MAAEEEPSRAAGACVLVVLGGVLVAVLFAVDEAVGVLGVVLAGTVALYRSARRVSDSSTPPPPPSTGTVLAGETGEIDRIQEGPGEGLLILYPVREDIPGE
ncbi:hypothetical protein [Streptomyces sp. NBC_00582]|uniref:hypothetical protein n=1 Tax=Streptomyces sp. NBC_00582 TaxID=2975783 RepID=UPI002E8043B2|nr:hypothetical protein [Streptomyces sp. NBC_00582]WUB63871.1 hypothetical protein OG852_27495 [Streptomyces sp. NBC_00582]